MAFNRIQNDVLPAAASHSTNRFAESEVAPAPVASNVAMVAVPAGFIAVALPTMVLSLVAMQQQIYRAAYAKAVAAHQPRWLRNDWFSVN